MCTCLGTCIHTHTHTSTCTPECNHLNPLRWIHYLWHFVHVVGFSGFQFPCPRCHYFSTSSIRVSFIKAPIGRAVISCANSPNPNPNPTSPPAFPGTDLAAFISFQTSSPSWPWLWARHRMGAQFYSWRAERTWEWDSCMVQGPGRGLNAGSALRRWS